MNERIGGYEHSEQSESDQKIDQAFARLVRIAEVLMEEGCCVEDRFVTRDRLAAEYSYLPTPLTADSLIRFSYDSYRGLKVGFYNNYENPDNPERQRIESRLRQEELL